MITKAQVKHIQSLDDKKNRIAFGEFIVEGDKMVRELLSSNLTIHHVFALEEWVLANRQLLQNTEYSIVEPFELQKISMQQHPNQVLALSGLPIWTNESEEGVCLVLTAIQDPGNLGSIIRIADWFGVSRIYCSHDTVDFLNPKVVQASMGSVFRVPVVYTSIEELLAKTTWPIIGTALGGVSLASVEKISKGYVVIGNESKGVPHEILKFCTQQVQIPGKGEAESLNAAVATGIVCFALLS
jgi:TrmH family RNA methyltransferase